MTHLLWLELTQTRDLLVAKALGGKTLSDEEQAELDDVQEQLDEKTDSEEEE
jgi:hypothetical protein